MASLLSRSSVLSPIEEFVLGSPSKLFLRLFDRFEPAELLMLAKTNKALRRAVRLYTLKRWNIREFFKRHFQDIEAALDLLDVENAVVFGPSVCEFFYRTRAPFCSIDICIHVQSVSKFANFLAGEGYVNANNYGLSSSLVEAIERKLVRLREEKLKSSGDRNSNPDAALHISDGPSFDVLDWSSGTTRPESFLRISEPEVWRQWSDMRLSQYFE
ncbi:hypothetical protein CPB84DRAFT_1846974 [Gymnopilus junonius]|uniref:F-box domain-containing protein n=1 Tax=Gymnopilus junonius TaxID=109634 RepID=A0A9P5NPK3_GYMJU|nr:hypothetical protein CPB84DRAFT_1846974 [Gymnopilus junonius]